MTSTLITLFAAFAVCGLLVLALDARARASRRRDRESFRRLVRYMTVAEQTRRPW